MSVSRKIRFSLNGRPVVADIMTHETVVEVLTQRFDLRGARESCGQGLCGCCTVYVNGLAVSGCLHLAALMDGAEVTTIEGLEQGERLDPVQEAFISAGAFQCGFCTPGFIMMVKKLLEKHPDPTDGRVPVGGVAGR